MPEEDAKSEVTDRPTVENEIIKAVKKHNKWWPNNIDHEIEEVTQVGRSNIYTVKFKGTPDALGERRTYRNYVLVRRPKEKPIVFSYVEDLFNNISHIVVEPWKDVELIRIYMLGMITFLTFIVVIILIRQNLNPESLALFTTVLGSIVGYLIGDRRSAAKDI